MCQHRRAEGRRVPCLGPAALPLHPGQQRRIGRRLRVPDLLDLVHADSSKPRQRGLGEAGGHTHPQAAGDKLQKRPAARLIQKVQPSGNQLRHLAAASAREPLHHGGKSRPLAIGFAGPVRCRPHQRHRLGQIADEIIGQREKHRVRPLACQRPQHRWLGVTELQRARQGRKGIAPVRIGRAAEIIHQQRLLGIAGAFKGKTVQKAGKGTHTKMITRRGPKSTKLARGTAKGRRRGRHRRPSSTCLCCAYQLAIWRRRAARRASTS